jgi:alkaline phosphatase D
MVPPAAANWNSPFVKGSTRELRANLSPAYGLQFFGHVAIDGDSGVMTVSLKDVGDTVLWSKALEPVRA